MSPHTAPALRAGTWTVRSGRTTAGFEVRNFGFNRVHGTIPVRTGRVEVRDGAVTAVHAELDLGALDTRNERRDLDLRKPNLLDSAAQPDMTFAATGVRRQDHGWEVTGELRLRGTSCPLTLTVEPVTATRVRATGTLDRAPLGLRVPRAVIGRYVRIDVEAELEPPS
ncbi:MULTISPECIES: YceI family protein [unclassified Amycolatopsis]|uniref:YceI family protein n=1 Tax=unclassified Amycolatopsis TaxID=2618356 RepID=UPI002874F5CE|nr:MULTISPECIES: YceI family protein [unclassified Amycolatopsis]MDS0139194.1 YceI family protein [Amycolatopsis sp. 505]MDS0144426.1 YceI family protein [Amycolatopsis sp. CM201R]